MEATEGRSKRPRPYMKTGVFSLKKALKLKGIKAIDQRSVAARAVNEWRASVAVDLGGVEALSRQEQTLLDMAAAAVFLLGQIDAWIAAHPQLIVNNRRRSVAPVVRERITTAEHLARLLGLLGLKRAQRPVRSLAEVLAEQKAPAAASAVQAVEAEAQAEAVESGAQDGRQRDEGGRYLPFEQGEPEAEP
jgi:hypothetical protein